MRRVLGLLFSLILLLAGVFVFLNYQFVVDNVVASQYKPTAEVSQLTQQVQFTERGDFLFRATQAKLDDRQSFNRHCHKKAAETAVLGCYLGPQNIYIFDVDDPRLGSVKPVTAAHEMLHAAYERLPESERDEVNRLVKKALPDALETDGDLAERLKAYEKTEPGERANELHSIIGTEVETLPAELEDYYRQYFKDRRIITGFAAEYRKVFNDIKATQDNLVAELKALSQEIDELTSQHNAEAAELQSDIDSFKARADREGGFDSQVQFDSARQALLSRISQLETLRGTIEQKIDLYNSKKAELEALNVQVEDLNAKLDSTKTPNL